jgi:hypothetical protein
MQKDMLSSSVHLVFFWNMRMPKGNEESGRWVLIIVLGFHAGKTWCKQLQDPVCTIIITPCWVLHCTGQAE